MFLLIYFYRIFTDNISQGGNAIASFRPSVRPSVVGYILASEPTVLGQDNVVYPSTIEGRFYSFILCLRLCASFI